MKKKILFLLPVLALLLGACGGYNPSEDPSEEPGTSDVEVVESVTLDKTTAEVAVDEYVTLLATVLPYTVDNSVLWTSSDSAIASVNDSGRVKGVSVGEATITATSLVDPTKSASCVVTVVAEAQPISIAEALAAPDGTLVLVRGIVKEINTLWNEGYGNISVTIIDEALDELYVFRMSTKVEVGDDITISGEMATYNDSRQIAQGSTAVINSSDNEIPGGGVTYTEMTLAQALAAEDGTYAQVRGIVKTIDSAWNADYGNMNVTIIDESLTELYIYRLSTQVEVGDDITIQGKVTSHNGNKQLIEGVATVNSSGNEVPGGVEYVEMTIAEVLAAEDGTLVKVTGDVKTADEWNTQYNNMSVTITDGTNDLYVYRLATQVAVGDNITIEGKVGSYEGAKQIAAGATAVINSTGSGEDDEEEDGEMTIAEVLASEDGTAVVVTGDVKSIGTAWDSGYGNMSVTITDGTDDLYVFRLATQVAVGDNITVTGTVGSYNGSKQIAAGATAVINSSAEPTDPVEMTIPEALAADDGTKVIVRGIVKTADTWNTEYNNMSVYIVDADLNQLYVYRLATQVAVGDDITVTGSVGSYNGAKQIAAGATAVIHSSGNEVPTAQGIVMDVFASTGTYDETAKTITWTKDGVTFVNAQASSTYAIRTSDTDHFRMYAGSTFSLTVDSSVTYTTVTFVCTSSGYATTLAGCVTGGTATVDGSNVVVTAITGTLSGSLSAQARINQIIVA